MRPHGYRWYGEYLQENCRTSSSAMWELLKTSKYFLVEYKLAGVRFHLFSLLLFTYFISDVTTINLVKTCKTWSTPTLLLYTAMTNHIWILTLLVPLDISNQTCWLYWLSKSLLDSEVLCSPLATELVAELLNVLCSPNLVATWGGFWWLAFS